MIQHLIYTLYPTDKLKEMLIQIKTFLNVLVVAGADTFTFDSEKIVLEGGDRVIAVSQSPSNLVATISYLEV